MSKKLNLHFNAKDLTGVVSHYIRVDKLNRTRTKGGKLRWDCTCLNCGNKVTIISSSIILGKTRSCGCLTGQIQSEAHKNSGKFKGFSKRNPKIYRAWIHINNRCHNPDCDIWEFYGLRDIQVWLGWRREKYGGICDELALQHFADHIGEPPEDSPNIHLDRINSDGDPTGNYEPNNVRWVTARVNSLNKNTTRWITFRGETLCLTDWSIKVGISISLLWHRLNKLGWSIEKALITPVKKQRNNRIKGEMNNAKR